MTDEPSPRPWRVDEYDASLVRDANGRFVARADAADAALIVEAVNERDRLRDALKRIIDATYDIDLGCPDFRAIARAAVGEGETPTGKGVGR